jgi:hypothetical protein
VQATLDNNILNTTFAPIVERFGTDKATLEQQLKQAEARRALAANFQGIASFGDGPRKFALREAQEAIDRIKEKLKAFSEEAQEGAKATDTLTDSVQSMRQETERAVQRPTPVSAALGASAGPYTPFLPTPGAIVATLSQDRPRSLGQTTSGGTRFDDETDITRMGKGGQILGTNFSSGPVRFGANPYGIGGLERRAAGAYTTRQGDVLRVGAGEMLLDRSTAEGLRALVRSGGGRGGGVTITNPRFEVVMQGVDPRLIDGKQIMRALLPALREELRRAQYDVERL